MQPGDKLTGTAFNKPVPRSEDLNFSNSLLCVGARIAKLIIPEDQQADISGEMGG